MADAQVQPSDVAEGKRVSHFSRIYGVSPVTIRRWIEAGLYGIRLKAFTIGVRLLIKQSDWDNFQAEINRIRIKPEPDEDRLDAVVKRSEREVRDSTKAARNRINSKKKAG